MNLKDKIETMLYSYPSLKVEIMNLELDIEEKLNNYSTLSAVQYDKDSISKTYKFNSEVENKVIDIEKSNRELNSEISILKNKKRSKEIQVKRIENLLTALTERENIIIRRRYFEKVKNINIGLELNLTEEYICELKRGIINKLSKLIS